MLVIGLVGGIASGKSFVAECFELLGADVLDADKIGHEVLNEPGVIAAVLSQWPKVNLIEGRINRKSLASQVFGAPGDDRALKKLEQITHPLIGDRIKERLAALRIKQSVATVVDAPVMIKAGWHSLCDHVVFVESSLESRSTRAKSRGWAADELSKRELFQTPLDQKRQFASDVVDNSGSRHATIEQIQELWTSWGLRSPDKGTADFHGVPGS